MQSLLAMIPKTVGNLQEFYFLFNIITISIIESNCIREYMYFVRDHNQLHSFNDTRNLVS